MKTLLLLSSSRFLKNDFLEILGKPLGDYKIAHIITASKGKEIVDFSYLDRTREILKKQNCYFEDLDIDGKTESELRAILENFDGVFVNGGSTFYLLKSIREGGFGKIVKELLPQGFLYIGASAGSYVTCPTIETSKWKLDEKDIKDDCGLKDLTAMNLVPFLLKVHYQPEDAEFLKEKISQAKYPVRILTDEQAILVKGDEVTFLGGEEVKL